MAGCASSDIVAANSSDASISTLLRVDAATPLLVTLSATETWPGGVRLTWYTAQPLGAGVTAERRSSHEAWRTIGVVREDGDRLILEDDSVTPGGRYAYRLRGGPGNEPLTQEAWIDVPAGSPLALYGWSAGSHGARQVAFSLATFAPARLEVYDAAGRRLLDRTLERLNPGPHRIDLAEAVTWKAGIYFVRLVQGLHLARAKWCLLK